MNLNQVTLAVTELDRSVAFYRDLGFRLIVHAPPRYARFECPQGDATLSLHTAEAPADGSGTVIYFECEGLDALVQRLSEAGYVFEHGPIDQPWLWREARLKDPSGNLICLYWAGSNRKHPPWRLEG